MPDVSSPFYASALKGAQGALEQAGYRVMLMDSGQAADGEVAALRTLLAHRVDGLLLSTVGIGRELFDDVVGRRGDAVRVLRQRGRRRAAPAPSCSTTGRASTCSSTTSSSTATAGSGFSPAR